MQLAEGWFAKSYGATFDNTGDDAANGVALGLDGADEVGHLLGCSRIGAAHGVALNFGKVVILVTAAQCDGTYLRGVGCDAYALLAQHHLGKGSAYHAGYGFACRGASAAAVVAYAVLGLIGEVGM